MLTARRRTAAVVASVIAGAAGLAVAPSVGAATAKPGLITCDKKLSTSPSNYPLACGDGNIGLIRVSWSSFGGTRATGTGTLVVNQCDPTCADGTYTRTKVTILATRARTFGVGRSYTRISMTAASKKPAGRYGVDRNGPYTLEG